MDYQTITLEITNRTAVLTLNRPEKYNALTQQMRAEIAYAVPEAAANARVLVITGAGAAFWPRQWIWSAVCGMNTPR